jgi:hypothetical protein
MTNERVVFQIDAGSETGSLTDFVMKELTDEEIDEIEVKRKLSTPTGLANEPITIGVIIVASLKAVAAISTAISAYINYRAKKIGGSGQEISPQSDKRQGLEPIKLKILEGIVPVDLTRLGPEVQLEVK